jgi:alpha-glucosidase
MTRRWDLPRSVFYVTLFAAGVVGMTLTASAESAQTAVQSPDGRNSIVLGTAGDAAEHVRFTVSRDGREIIRPSLLGPVLAAGRSLGDAARIVAVQHGKVNESFQLLWGKTATANNCCSYAVVTLATRWNLHWEVELRAYDDGVAFRYRLPLQAGLSDFELHDEVTQFDVAGEPTALFNTLGSFTTSHESLYERKPVAAIPARKLLDMPLLLWWLDGRVAAITEARVRDFAGAYLERTSVEDATLRCRLSPLPSRNGVCVVGKTPHASPWRVVLLADVAGKLLESNLLECLNDPQLGDFNWLRPGKSTFHWWNGAFEDDYRLPLRSGVSFDRHREYIDFCARNNIAYHALSGDGRAWYMQSETDYGTPALSADILTPRPEIELPKILAYARTRGVGIRLWVHWKPLSKQLEEAFTRYESWGVKGLMVDFLNRDDQEMIDFTERMLDSALRHKLHIQIHGCSKFSGEQRTFPHLFNREGVLNLEYVKWSNLCTPAHNVNVAYTRALAGPVDYHLGGFRSVSRAEFQPRDRGPVVMGTRCHQLALYVVYENPMPMVADAPSAYEGQTGFDFIAEVPTTWDETRFLAGDPGEYVVVARRKADAWYVGGITNWTPREIDVPVDFLAPGEFAARLYVDGCSDEAHPNAITQQRLKVNTTTPFRVSLAPGGGFVAILRASPAVRAKRAGR